MARLDGFNDLALTYRDPAWVEALSAVGVQGAQSGSIRAQLEALPAALNGALEPLCDLVGVPFDPNATFNDTLDSLLTTLTILRDGLNASQELLRPQVTGTTVLDAAFQLSQACNETHTASNTLYQTAGGLPPTERVDFCLGYMQNQVAGSMPFLQDTLEALGAASATQLFGRVVNVRGPIVTFYNRPPLSPGASRQWGNADAQFVSAFAAQYPGETPETGTFAQFQAVLTTGNWS